MTKPSRRSRSNTVEQPIEVPPRDIAYNQATGTYDLRPMVQWDNADRKLGSADDTVTVTVVVQSKEISEQVSLLAIKKACIGAGVEGLIGKWAGVKVGTREQYADGIALARLTDGKLALQLEVKIWNKAAWDSVEHGVSATTMRNRPDPHFEYVHYRSLVLIRSFGDDYLGNNLAFEVLRGLAGDGKAPYGYMWKVRNKRSIKHARALVISNSDDEKAVQDLVHRLGSKRRVVSDLAALDDKPAARTSTPEPSGSTSSGTTDPKTVPAPEFDVAWSDPQWSQLREYFLNYCVLNLDMENEVSFLNDVAEFEKGASPDLASQITTRYLDPHAPHRINSVLGSTANQAIEEMRRYLAEPNDVGAGFFARITDELLAHLQETYNRLFLAPVHTGTD